MRFVLMIPRAPWLLQGSSYLRHSLSDEDVVSRATNVKEVGKERIWVIVRSLKGYMHHRTSEALWLFRPPGVTMDEGIYQLS
jgi:hypothetical protein